VVWAELFFDLIFVVFITQLADGLHGDPGPVQFATFLGLYFPAWWAWSNTMILVNVLPDIRNRTLILSLIGGMIAVGAMAVAAPEGTGDRAAIFALGCAGLRLVYLPLSLYRAKNKRLRAFFPWIYCGITAGLWIVSIWVPQPWQFIVWAFAILVEIVIVNIGERDYDSSTSADVNIGHVAERLSLFMVIVMGESVLSLVLGLSEHYSALSAIAALAGFGTLVMLALSFFVYGVNRLEEGLVRLRISRNSRALRDTVMYLPYVLVVGVTMVAAGFSTGVTHPNHPFAVGAAITLGGGIGLFYLTNAIVAVRFGEGVRSVLPWAIPGVLVAAVLIPLGVVLPALFTVCLAFVATGAMVLLAVIRGGIRSRLNRGLEATGDTRGEQNDAG
jgi:low temperature requirement protein LtrA